MNALGQLCSGVAHDFRNVLGNVAACFALLDRQALSESGRQVLAEGQRVVDRGIDVTNRMLTFARHQTSEPAYLDLDGLIDNMRGMLTRSIGPGIFIRFHPSEASGLQAHGRKGEIELALLNLVLNARDAMPDGGSITIEVHGESVMEDGGHIAPGEYVRLSVTDTGIGIPPGSLAKVSKPFYTTKPERSGTGLGLSIVNGMMKELGGGMRISSTVGIGTCVSLYFPDFNATASAD